MIWYPRTGLTTSLGHWMSCFLYKVFDSTLFHLNHVGTFGNIDLLTTRSTQRPARPSWNHPSVTPHQGSEWRKIRSTTPLVIIRYESVDRLSPILFRCCNSSTNSYIAKGFPFIVCSKVTRALPLTDPKWGTKWTSGCRDTSVIQFVISSTWLLLVFPRPKLLVKSPYPQCNIAVRVKGRSTTQNSAAEDGAAYWF
jgi:hypothetical protein